MAIKKLDLTKAYKPREKKHRTDRGYYIKEKSSTGKTAVNLDWQNMENRISRPEFVFSVIIPAYNAREYILAAMESAVCQDVELPIEVIVIDDCSTDDTYEIIEAFARKHPSTPDRCITILRNSRNSGVAYSRNQGVAHAAGEYVAFLDADDWWDEKKLRLQYEHLVRACQKISDARDRAQMVGRKISVRYPVLSCTARQLTDAEGKPFNKIIHVPETISGQMLLKTNHIPCSSVLLKTAVAREFPMAHDELHEDYLTWLKITKAYGPAIGLDQPLVFSRMSPEGKSRNKWKSARMQYRCYRQLRISPLKSAWYMMNYAVEGVAKYR